MGEASALKSGFREEISNSKKWLKSFVLEATEGPETKGIRSHSKLKGRKFRTHPYRLPI